MSTEENVDGEFHQTGGGHGHRILNCPSSGMKANQTMAMSSGSGFRPSGGSDPFFGSGWDSLVSMSHTANFGGSSMVTHGEFSNPHFSVLMENQGIGGNSHLVNHHHHPSESESGLVELVPKFPCFGSGNFSEIVGSFGLPDGGGNKKTSRNGANFQEDCQISDEGSLGTSPNGSRKRRAMESHSPFNPNKNVEGGQSQSKDLSGDSSDQDEKKQKIEKNVRNKQVGKQAKDNSDKGGDSDPKDSYIHVRARRGQATNSHSLAERVRRERISERMRLLQELVPGCNKITGKAVMLDEIINYVQSLQQQVEFLSMKLATVNPELNIDIDRILSKDILHSRGGGNAAAAVLGFGPSSHPFTQGTMPGVSSTNAQLFHPMPQNVWDNELQNLLQMGFDSNTALNNLGPNGRSKFEL